jgi:hypothetical protein
LNEKNSKICLVSPKMATEAVEEFIVKASNGREFMYRSIKLTPLQAVRTGGHCQFLKTILTETL